MTFEHHELGQGAHRIMGITPENKVGSMLEYYRRSDGSVEHEKPTGRDPGHQKAVLDELHRIHPQATPKAEWKPPAAPEGPDEGPFFHGTTVARVRKIMPASAHRRHVTFPHDTDRDHAYATSDVEDAWEYAQKAHAANSTGRPRVYQVEPLGHVERDPRTDAQGRMRGNYESDHRSRDGWKVVRELPMPKHMGDPRKWDV
jgi:hypothetical protein